MQSSAKYHTSKVYNGPVVYLEGHSLKKDQLGFWDRIFKSGHINRQQHMVMSNLEAQANLVKRPGEIGLVVQAKLLEIQALKLSLKLGLDNQNVGALIASSMSLLFYQFFRELRGDMYNLAVWITPISAAAIMYGLTMLVRGLREERKAIQAINNHLESFGSVDPEVDRGGDIRASINSIRFDLNAMVESVVRSNRLVPLMAWAFCGIFGFLFIQFMDVANNPFEAVANFFIPMTIFAGCSWFLLRSLRKPPF